MPSITEDAFHQAFDRFFSRQEAVRHGGAQHITSNKLWKKAADDVFVLPQNLKNIYFSLRSIYHKYLYEFEKVDFPTKNIAHLDFEDDEEEMAIMEKQRIELRKKNTQSESIQPYNPTRLSSIPSFWKPGMTMNPDDDGKDEKYLLGGHHCRLLLSLESSLPNEIEWSLTKLVRISCTCPLQFDTDVVPGLLECLVDLLGPFFDHLTLNTTVGHHSTVVSTKKLPKPDQLRMFSIPKEQEDEFERVYLVLLILRNFSFLPIISKKLATNHSMIEYIAKGIALAHSSSYIAIKQDCLTILENISQSFKLQTQNDFFLHCLRENTFGSDRSMILTSVRALTIFCSIKDNHKFFITESNENPQNDSSSPPPSSPPPLKKQKFDNVSNNNGDDDDDTLIFLNRLFELLIVFYDQELVSTILDYIYQFSSIGPEACKKIAAVSLPQIANPITFISKFINFDGSPKPITSIVNLEGPYNKTFNNTILNNNLVKKPSPTNNQTTHTNGSSSVANGLLLSGMKIPESKFVNNTSQDGQIDQKQPSEKVDAEVDLTADEFNEEDEEEEDEEENANVEFGDGMDIDKRDGDEEYIPLPVDPVNQTTQEDGVVSPPKTRSESTPVVLLQSRPIFELKCFWKTDGNSYCSREFENADSLASHVQTVHTEKPINGKYACKWKQCTALPLSQSRARLLAHFQTHLPPIGSESSYAGSVGKEKSKTTPGQSVLNINDLCGISLTSLLLLRNLAKFGRCEEKFEGRVEMDMALISCDERYSKFTTLILNELQN